jgi:type IV secretion system protein VirD4
VDTDDVHTLMIGASGVGKTAFFLYPNLEYACATGMSFLCTDTKGDLFRNYGAVARDYYGYNISVIDLRNPTRSDGNNLLHLVNKYMDEYRKDERNLAAKAKAEKYAKDHQLRPLLTPPATAPTTDKTPSSMTRRKVC